MLKLAFYTVIMICAFITFNLGMDHINFGTGLNPWIAFPITFLMVCLGLCIYIADGMQHIYIKDEDDGHQ